MEPEIVRRQSRDMQSINATKTCPGQPLCICCKYRSPVKVENMLPFLELYPDNDSAAFLKGGFEKGFKLSYHGERSARESKNLKSVENDANAARVKLGKEIKMGRIAGPFKERPIHNLIVSPIGLIPKAEAGKFRLIQHLSHPHGNSINDGIDKAACTVQYTKFDVAVELVVKVGKAALMAKADVESAFRLLPIHPDDFCLLGMKIEDEYYVDKALPMGSSCSPAYFEKFSSFIEWVVRKESNSNKIIHYMDDFFFCGSEGGSISACKHLVGCFETICAHFGIPLSKDKSVGPVTVIEFLGLEIDSVKQQVRVPERKLGPIKEKLKNALKAHKISLRDLQSLVGSLSFICRAVPPGRAFLRRLIDMQLGVKESWHKIKMSAGAKEDLSMWSVFLEKFNGSSLFGDQYWLGDQDMQFFTDASGVGFGGFYQGNWFQGKWPADGFSKNHSIAWLELFPIVVAVSLWGKSLSCKRVVLRCDNEAVVTILNKQTSKCPLIMRLMRFLVLQCLKLNLIFKAIHVPGKENNIADSLSRFQMARFAEMAPEAAGEPAVVPNFLWKI